MVRLKLQNSLRQLKNEKALVHTVVEAVRNQLVGVDLMTMKYNSQ